MILPCWIAKKEAKPCKDPNVLSVEAYHLFKGAHLHASSQSNKLVFVFTHNAPLGEKRLK